MSDTKASEAVTAEAMQDTQDMQDMQVMQEEPTITEVPEGQEFDDELDDDLDELVDAHTHVHGPNCNHDHDHAPSGYDPVQMTDPSVNPDDRTEEDQARDEMLKNLTPEQMRQLATMMMMQNPAYRQEMLKEKARRAMMQKRLARMSKRERERFFEREAARERRAQQASSSLPTALDATDNIDAEVKMDEGEEVEDLDAADDGVDSLPTMGDSAPGKTDSKTESAKKQGSKPKPAVKRGGRRGGRRKRKGKGKK